MKNRWIKKDGAELIIAVETVEDETRKLLTSIQQSGKLADSKVLADLRKRKMVKVDKKLSYDVKKGPKYAKEMPVEVTDLTADMLASGAWETANFKAYNFNALGGSQTPGALHPLNKVREEFRKIFFNQGFVEMPTAR
jgi:phenylalanyl-tRNA synthetase alpha chain